METFNFLMHGFAVASTPENLMIALVGAFIGTVVGMLPGLGPINGVAILLPFAFALGLPPESALILLSAVNLNPATALTLLVVRLVHLRSAALYQKLISSPIGET